MPTHGPRRLWRWGIAAAVLVLVVAGVAVAAVLVLHKPGNVSHPSVEFTAPPTTATTTPPPSARPRGQHLPVAALRL